MYIVRIYVYVCIKLEGVVGKIMASKDVPALILRTCECVTLCDKRDLADVVKVKDITKGR